MFDVHVSDIFTPLCAGGTVCVPSDDDRFRYLHFSCSCQLLRLTFSSNIAGAMRDMRVTHAMLVPSLLSSISPEDVDLVTLKNLMTIGENLPAHLVERWASFPGLRMINAYGPAECTPACCLLDMSRDGTIAGNIGRPMGSALWIVDPSNPEELLPVGQEGELVIEGPIVGRGYMGEEKKTAAVFINAPAWLKKMRGGASTRIYKTGDLCRYIPNGTIEYIGRNDFQVKIRGQRMELGEVEYHLRRALPRTADLAVEAAALGTNNKQPKLIAFVSLKPTYIQGSVTDGVSKGQESVDELKAMVPELKQQISKFLPEFMVPSTFIAMDFIPRLASAKTDRKSLRAVAATISTSSSASTELRAPTTEMEEKLRQVWAETFSLDASNIGIDDGFFDLGGDSIAAIRMRLASRRIGIEMTMKEIFDSPTIAKLASVARTAGTVADDVEPFELIQKDTAEGVKRSAAAQCGISVDDIEDIYPATMNACYFMLTSEAAPNWWTSYHTFPLPADIDLDRYLECWKSAMSAYQNLRSRIIRTETAILQVVLRKEKETIRNAEDLNSFIEGERRTTMNWGESLSRYCLVEESSGQRYFVWTAKQAIFDAWSLHLMAQSISKAYYTSDYRLADPLKPSQLVKFKLASDITPAKNWFKTYFAGVRPDPIFSTPPDYKFETDVYESRELSLPAPSAKSTGFTMSTISAVAWAFVLGQHTGSKDVCLGLVRSGRNVPVPETDKYMGPMTSLMPLRVRLDGSVTVHELLQKYQSDWLESSAYDAYSYIEFIMDSEVEPAIKGAVTSTISLNIVHPLDSAEEEKIQKLPEGREIPAGATQKPLNLNVFLKRDGNLRVMTRRDHMACTKELAEAFVDSFENIAGQLRTADAQATVSQVSVPDTSNIKRSYFPDPKSAPQHDVSAQKESVTDLSPLKGKSILITGGASGLGLATTRAFAAAGAYITIADIQSAEDVGKKLIEEFSSQGHHVTFAHCDTTDYTSQVGAFKHAVKFAPTKTLDIVALFAGVTAEHGSIMDHLVNVTPSLDKDPPPPQIRSINTNLLGVYYSAYLALNYFRLPSISSQSDSTTSSLPNKQLLFINSLAGYIDFPNHTTYNVSKFGVRGLFRSIRSEAKKAGARCNLIAPWLVKTPMTEALQHKFPGDQKGLSWAKTEDVVDCVSKTVTDVSVDGKFADFKLSYIFTNIYEAALSQSCQMRLSISMTIWRVTSPERK